MTDPLATIPTDRGYWRLFWFLALFTGLIAVFHTAGSQPVEVRLLLVPSTTTSVRVFRVLRTTESMALRFRHSTDAPAGGRWESSRGYADKGYLSFPVPGAAIKLGIVGSGGQAIFEALPSSFSGGAPYRGLVPFRDDGDPKRFPWPPDHTRYVSSPAGWSSVQITVLEVDPQIAGAEVDIVFEPPVTLKRVANGYEWFWWSMFWPVYGMAVLIFGWALLVRRRGRLERSHTQS